mmetsp:Transcript_11020/g.23629  ORF Transcript_11020/g.23629 Transcript_11020/m.23629 type:complete len:203 (-) Transcript_11020:726-1334(-)
MDSSTHKAPLSRARSSAASLLRALAGFALAVVQLPQLRCVPAPLFGAKHALVAISHAVRSTHRVVLLRTKHGAPAFAPAFRNRLQIRFVIANARLLKLTRVPVRLAIRPAHRRTHFPALHICALVLTRCNRWARRFDAHHFLEHARLSRFTAALRAHVGAVRLRLVSSKITTRGFWEQLAFLERATLDHGARVWLAYGDRRG